MMVFYLIAMHSLFVTSFLVSGAILIKTKWWRYDVALNALLFSVGMAFITLSILLRYYGTFEDTFVYAIVLSIQLVVFSLLYLWRFIALLYYNWHFWAWSKDDTDVSS